MTLTRAEILAAKDIEIVEIKVPKWGGSIWVKSLSAREREEFEAALFGTGKLELHNIRAKMASLAVCDENGNPLFTEEDIEELNKKNTAVLQKIFVKCQELSGIGDKVVEKLAKNSSSTP